MAKPHYEGDLYKGIAFSGDAGTGNLPLCGDQVEEYLKGADFGLDSKVGCLYFDEENKRYLAFADEDTRDDYLDDPTRTDLILGEFENSSSEKIGCIYLDEDNNMYLCFADEESRDEYLADPTKTYLILAEFSGSSPNKIGCIYTDEENEIWLCFADEESRDEYLEDPTKTELVLATFTPIGLDKKIGVIYNDEENNRYLAFADASTEAAWIENPSRMDLVLAQFTAGSGDTADTYSMVLTVDSSSDLTISDATLILPTKAMSTVKYGSTGDTEFISESVQIQIQTRTSSASAWIPRGSIDIAANLPNFTDIDVSQYLQPGQNYIRIRGVGEYATSIWKSFSVYVVALQLVPNSTLEVPFSGSTLTLNYLVGGAISKVLQFEFGTGLGISFEKQFSYLDGDPGCTRNVGTSTNLSTGMTFTFNDATMMETLMAAGVHTVRARLYVSEDVKTDWIESQYMVADDSHLYVGINDVHDGLDNWSDVTFFKYSVSYSGLGTVDLVFKLIDSASHDVLAQWNVTASNNIMYTFSTQLGIEIEDHSVTNIYAYMHVQDSEGNELTDPVFFDIGNSADYAPTEGADLIISPAQRSNSEANPRTIINQVDSSVIDSSWVGFGFSTDGWIEVLSDVDDNSSAKVHALSIPAGRKLTINYNPFSDFMTENNTGKSVTVEIDFRTNQILDYDEKICTMCSIYPNDQRAWGFEMLPLEAYLMTNKTRNLDDQNVTWAEGVRQHMAINVVYGLRGRNLVRIFLDGRIEREFTYDIDDIFVGENISMVFGADNSDIDIFGIRVYKKALSTAEVMQDRKAAYSTVSEKIAFNDSNDILGDDDCIDFTKASQKYNVLGLTGHLAKYGDMDKGKTKHNKLTVHKPLDASRSGTLTELENAGQGTTAMTYYDWNQQQKISDNSMFYPEWDPTNPSSAAGGYAPAEGETSAKKLCGKINFASSMQGHKMGLTRIYTEVFKQLIQQGSMSRPSQLNDFPNARIAVFEEPYLFFHRETENDPWVFKYLMTWGSAKGDKPTFGYDKKKTPKMLMLEGALNDAPLALFKIPWNDDITYNADAEAFMYNGAKNINFGFGHTAVDASTGDEYPDDEDALASFRNFFNFNYLHNQRITYFSGTLTQLRNASEEAAPHGNFYWVTADDTDTGSERYDLFRYDALTSNWVNAGVDGSVGNYERLNLRTQYEAFCAEDPELSPVSWTAGQWDVINNIIIDTRTKHFKHFASNYMHTDDALYHSCFVKLFAGTDNRAKNTYYYTDPSTLKIRHMQDDLDTMIKTNNVGQNRKPYYVEEHDKDAYGDYYWQGEDCVYYNLLESAFVGEMDTMMNNMLGAMSSLGGNAFSYITSRLLEAQSYFPAIAYNEMARLVYENADVAQAAGIYSNGTRAISQSCGTQYWSEYDWIKSRVMYISSWCEYGEFAVGTSSPNALNWRGRAGYPYDFVLTPAKWLYPRVGVDTQNFDASTNAHRVRVPAGQTIHYKHIDALSGDGTIYIKGINYYLDIGDMNIANASTEFMFQGKLLQTIKINPDGTDPNIFNSTTISIGNATNIKSIIIRNESYVTSAFDLTKCTRLETIDLRGSEFSIVNLPVSERLHTVHFGDNLNTLRIDNQPNLQTVTIEGVANLKNVYVDQAKAGTFDSRSLASNIWESVTQSGGSLTSARFLNINWSNVKADMLMYYNASPVSIITGRINMIQQVASDRYLLFEEIQKLVDKYGNIQSESNSLYINYPTRTISSFNIKGDKYIKQTGIFNGWTLYTLPTTGNNVRIDTSTGKEAVNFSFTGENASAASNYATIVDPVRGVLNVTRLQTNEETFTIRVVMTFIDGSSMTVDKKVGFFNRIPKLNDFAYVDGTFDDEYDLSKSLAGVVYRTEQVDSSHYKVMVYAKENATVKSTDGTINTAELPWGLYQDNGGSSGFPAATLNVIKDATGLSSAVDVDGNPNITNTGLLNADGSSSDYRYVDDNYLDNTKNDGYRVITTGVCGVSKESAYNSAWDSSNLNTANLNHCNRIIEYYLQEQYQDASIRIPTNTLQLGDAMVALQNANSGATNVSRYRQFYYPATYACNMYQPEVSQDMDEHLDPQYATGNWMLPSCGELCRIYNFYHNSCGRTTSNRTVSIDYADENPESEALTPLFSNLLLRIRRVTQGPLPFNMPTSATYWSASEYTATYSWYVNFSSGYVNSNYLKNDTCVSRAVAAYVFSL